MSIWSVLGISPTKNVREIKRAYAAKSKLVHPEEHPEEFQKLHEAYKAALNIANSNVAFSAPEPEKQTTETEHSAEKKQNEMQTEQRDNIFDFAKKSGEHTDDEEMQQEQSFDFSKAVPEDNLHDDIIEQEESFDFQNEIQKSLLRHDNEVMEKTEIVIKKMNELYYQKMHDKESDWLNIFQSDFVREIMCEPIFLKELCRFLNAHKVYEPLANAVFKSFQLGSVTSSTAGELSQLYNIIYQARIDALEQLNNKIKLCWVIIFLLFCISFILLANEMWIAVIIAMLLGIINLVKIDALKKKRKKNFYE